MTQDTQFLNHYIADEGKVFINKDGAYGTEVWLGTHDSIENWTEINEEEISDARD